MGAYLVGRQTQARGARSVHGFFMDPFDTGICIIYKRYSSMYRILSTLPSRPMSQTKERKYLDKTETTRKMWSLAEENGELLHYPGDGRLWHRPDGEHWTAPGLFIELRIERNSYQQKDPRLLLVAHALRRDREGQIHHYLTPAGDYMATIMARSDWRPTFSDRQLESAAGRIISWGHHVAETYLP